MPNGKPLTNPDGTPKKTVAKDLEIKFLARPGIEIQVVRELDEQIGTENQKRQALNSQRNVMGLPPLPMISKNSEEAKVMQSDIVLEKLRNNMPPSVIQWDDAGQKAFDNQMRRQTLALAQKFVDTTIAFESTNSYGDWDGHYWIVRPVNGKFTEVAITREQHKSIKNK